MRTEFLKAEKVAVEDSFVSVEIAYVGNVCLKVGCESDFSVHVNDEFIFSEAYSAPYGKTAYDEFYFSGEGKIKLVFCKFPHGSSIYKSGKSLIIYELTDEKGDVLAYSRKGGIAFADETVRIPEYSVTAQIGRSFEYDLTGTRREKVVFEKSENKNDLIARPVKKCRYTDRRGKIVAKGGFTENGGENPAEIAEYAWLDFRADRSQKLFCGEFAVYDLGAETTGQIFFDITVRIKTKIIIGYGEDFIDRVHSFINGRNFAFSYTLGIGENKFVQPFGRMGGRYLALFSFGDISVKEIGVKEPGYPVERKEIFLIDELDRKIYDTAVRTNYLCMHSHYEDCPWREQAFYGMDAALQMKYAYTFFCGTTFPKENLRLFYSTQRADGLFDLCAPSEIGTTIPSFSLFAVMALSDYYEFSRDKDFVFEMREKVERLFDAFLKRLNNRLIPRFYEKQYWNFYEWKDDLDGGDIFRLSDQLPVIDLPLNALLVMSLKKIGKVFDDLKIPNGYSLLAEEIKEKLDRTFFDEKKKAFRCFFYDGNK